MFKLTLVCLLLVACPHSSLGQDEAAYPAPENVLTDVTERSVFILWNAVPDAPGYLVTLNNTRTETTTGLETAFGGLKPSTTYVATVVATDFNGTTGDEATVEFETNMGPPRNLAVNEITETTMSVIWSADKDMAIEYRVRLTNDNNENIENNITISGNKAFVSGLNPITFYKFYVRSVTDGKLSGEAMIRARTDGSGVRITAWWDGYDGTVGGEGMIYRPRKIPQGTYLIQLQLPCSVQNITFWHAELDEELSRPDTGFYQLFQNETWQRRKTEIGFVFDFEQDDSSCQFVESNITINFSLQRDLQKANTTIVDVPILRDEWLTSSQGVANYAGKIELQFANVFHGTNKDILPKDDTIMKPATGSYIISLDAGEGCPGGLTIPITWGMELKDTELLPESKPNVAYFVQEVSQWTIIQLGLLYGYDPSTCPDRSRIKCSVLVDGPLVDAVLKAPNLQ